MVAVIPLSPYVQVGGNSGLFNAFSTGVRQGTAYPDPATRFRLRMALLAQSETIPMWGGVGVYLNVPGSQVANLSNPSYALGPICGRALALTGASALAGFSVFDEAYAMVTSPQSPVPLIGSYGQVMSYALGSRARIVVACDPSLASEQRQTNIAGQVSWDFVNQLLIPYIGTLTITSGTYVSATGVITLAMSAPITFGPGDSVALTGLTGTGGYATLDGTWTAITGTTGSTVVLQGPAGAGASTITGGSATVGGAGASQALPVTVLDIQTTNAEVVQYSSTTGFYTWNYNGSAALVQLTGGTSA